MPPCRFIETVVERQCRGIEPDIRGALHVVVAAKDVCPAAKTTDISRRKQKDAACPHVGGPHGVLGLAHAPDQCGWFFRREDLGDPLELFAWDAGNPLDLLRRPLRDLLTDLVHAIHALTDEFLVLPAVLEDVPQQAPDDRDIRARPDADIVRRVRGRPRHAGVDDDEIRPVELLAGEQMLQRNGMRLGRISAHDQERLGSADIVVAVGHRAVAPGIGHARDGGRMAEARLMVGIIGAPQRRKLAEQIRGLV